MMEVAVVVGLDGQPIHWHLPPGRSAVYIPDTRDLWEVLWENRENLAGVAHSHPGSGRTGPSMTDLTTFDAVERGLGKRLAWWITTSDHMIELKWRGPDPLDFVGWEVRFPNKARSTRNWTDELRRLTYDNAHTGGTP
jgi:proteasome lid subunit RPN8/RPN11